MTLKVGDKIPEGFTLSYIPYSEDKKSLTACGLPQSVHMAKDWKDKKVALIAIPGAFTPTCTASHVPPLVEKVNDFRAKGVDVIGVIAANDPFVMSAFGKASGGADKVLFLSDPNAAFSKSIGWALDLTDKGFGVRTGRYAIVFDHGKVTYAAAESESGGEPTVSSAATLLSHL